MLGISLYTGSEVATTNLRPQQQQLPQLSLAPKFPDLLASHLGPFLCLRLYFSVTAFLSLHTPLCALLSGLHLLFE